jgi:hypothetical protein
VILRPRRAANRNRITLSDKIAVGVAGTTPPLDGAAIAALAGLQGPTTPDVGTYAVALPVLIAGKSLSDLWWSMASPGRVSPQG